jgi:hypothetical protein
MAEKRRQIGEGRFERQGARIGQKTRHEFETSPAGRRTQARFFLRKDDWYEEEAYQREDRERPKQPD